MARKLKLNLTGLQNQRKRGIAKVEYLDGEIEFPIYIKDDRAYRKILAMGDYKYKTSIYKGKFSATKLSKISNLNSELRDIIYNSEGFNATDVSYVKIYDENELNVVRIDRDTIINGLMVVAHIDFDYVIDEKKGTKFIDVLNEQFEDIITREGLGTLESTDYYRITELLYEIGILSMGVIQELGIQITAIKNGTDIEEERYRFEARELGINEETYIDMKKTEKELLNSSTNTTDEVLEEEEV